MNKAVFIDRDGVINRAIVRNGKPFAPVSIDYLEILPGVLDSLLALHAAGWIIIVITNQPDVARGTQQRANVEAMNEYLKQHLPIDDFKTCYHDTLDGCQCRKPSPGALISAAKAYDIDLTSSFMVGDRWKDVEAGNRAGCKTIFIDCDYNEKKPQNFDYKVHSLCEASKIILKGHHE